MAVQSPPIRSATDNAAGRVTRCLQDIVVDLFLLSHRMHLRRGGVALVATADFKTIASREWNDKTRTKFRHRAYHCLPSLPFYGGAVRAQASIEGRVILFTLNTPSQASETDMLVLCCLHVQYEPPMCEGGCPTSTDTATRLRRCSIHQLVAMESCKAG